jgi:hypothetical protein
LGVSLGRHLKGVTSLDKCGVHGKSEEVSILKIKGHCIRYYFLRLGI